MVYSPAANTLISSAWAYAQNRKSHALDVMHIMAFALEHPEYAGVASDVLLSLEQAKRANWSRMISYELDMRPREMAGGGYPAGTMYVTPLYSVCEQQWNARTDALSAYVGVNCALVLGTILANDQTLARMAYYCDVNLTPLIHGLEARVQMAEGSPGGMNGMVVPAVPGYPSPPTGGLPGSYPTPPLMSPPRMAPDTVPFSPHGFGTDPRVLVPAVPYLERAPYVGRSLLQRIGRPVTATPAGLYAHIHPPISTQLIDSLSEGRRGREITVFAGKCGTAAQAVPQVIADRLAHVDRSNPLRAIRDLTGITVVHAGDLLDETQRDTPSAQDIQGLFQEARDRRVILVVDDAELLAKDFGDFELREQVLRELARPSDVPIFAIFHLGEDERYEAGRVSLGLHNAEPVQLLPDSEERTRTLLKSHFGPYWQQQGYIIHDPEKAFELLFKLAPEIRVTRHRAGKSWDERKQLPYAVIDVGTEAIEMLAKNQDVLYVAQAALSTLGPIRAREREIEKSEMRDALKRAEEDIRKLVSKTKPEYRTQMPMELTRAHLMAQFFYPSGTQFRPFASRPDEVVPAQWTMGEVERR